MGTLAAKPRIRRDWHLALDKVHGEGRCRACGRQDVKLEAAHLAGREYDRRSGYVVLPERVIPLCGPVGDARSCHAIYDGPASQRKMLGLIEKLEPEEVEQMVSDLGSLGLAWRRLTGEVMPD